MDGLCCLFDLAWRCRQLSTFSCFLILFNVTNLITGFMPILRYTPYYSSQQSPYHGNNILSHFLANDHEMDGIAAESNVTIYQKDCKDSAKLIGAKSGQDKKRENPARNLYEYARAAAGTLGDIMSTGDDQGSKSTSELMTSSLGERDGLVTTAIPSGSLASRFGITHPLDRMVLTANGNLQRLVSSYYDAPVQVMVDYCQMKDSRDIPNKQTLSVQNDVQGKTWDRVVHLVVHNQTFCTAHSIIMVYDPDCQALVESGAVGLGQLFRYLNILPEFELHAAAPYPAESGGGFWRKYTLTCAELACHIHEDFQSHIWDIRPNTYIESRL